MLSEEWKAILAIVGIIAGFYFFGLWVGLIVFLVISIIMGWKFRHKGPF